MRSLPHLFCIIVAFYFAFQAVMSGLNGHNIIASAALCVVFVWLAGIRPPINWFFNNRTMSSMGSKPPSFGGQ